MPLFSEKGISKELISFGNTWFSSLLSNQIALQRSQRSICILLSDVVFTGTAVWYVLIFPEQIGQENVVLVGSSIGNSNRFIIPGFKLFIIQALLAIVP